MAFVIILQNTLKDTSSRILLIRFMEGKDLIGRRLETRRNNVSWHVEHMQNSVML